MGLHLEVWSAPVTAHLSMCPVAQHRRRQLHVKDRRPDNMPVVQLYDFGQSFGTLALAQPTKGSGSIGSRADLPAPMNQPCGAHSRCARGAAGVCSTTVAWLATRLAAMQQLDRARRGAEVHPLSA